jgi:hypothetical protein
LTVTTDSRGVDIATVGKFWIDPTIAKISRVIEFTVAIDVNTNRTFAVVIRRQTAQLNAR